MMYDNELVSNSYLDLNGTFYSFDTMDLNITHWDRNVIKERAE